jgi:beta-ureidopropionase / N-carbamoyl-L-amino-acid hydrolase
MNVTEKLQELAKFNAEPNLDKGVTRRAFTTETADASTWLLAEMEALGMRSRIDAAGNVIGVWESGEGKAVAIGSHFDTVPNGGLFDGMLGVVSGLAAVEYLRNKNVTPSRPIMILAFNSEEWQDCPMLGSLSFCGDFDMDYFRDRRIPEVMQSAGFDYEKLPHAYGLDDIAAFLELHIEQGPVLEHAAADIGVITGVTGSRLYLARYIGEANHSGTTPLALRRDALLGAAEAVIAIRELGEKYEARTTVGTLVVSPGALNIIPGSVEFGIDIRTMDASALETLVKKIPDRLQAIAKHHGLSLEMEQLQHHEPLIFDKQIGDIIRDVAVKLGMKTCDLPSGAGHDARNVARHNIPTGMLFVPSQNGISHSYKEYTTPEQCDAGVAVLQQVLEQLVTETEPLTP